METENFAKGVERLIDPVTVGSIHFLQQFAGLLPRSVQRAALERSSRTSPYMGFVVEPYAFFVFSEVIDEKRASELLPTGFRLARACVFEGDTPVPLACASYFRVHTSAFWGARAEFYLIAENERTGLLSWIIVDYISDTISYDRTHALRGPSSHHAVVTMTADGRVLVDMTGEQGAHSAFSASLAGAQERRLDERLWIEGNLSVGYGKELSANHADVFSLTFPPETMARALEVPPDNLNLEAATWHADIIAPKPTRLVCFPYAQHLLSDSPGQASHHTSKTALAHAANSVNFDALRTFSVGSVRTGMLVSTALSAGLVVALGLVLAKKR